MHVVRGAFDGAATPPTGERWARLHGEGELAYDGDHVVLTASHTYRIPAMLLAGFGTSTGLFLFLFGAAWLGDGGCDIDGGFGGVIVALGLLLAVMGWMMLYEAACKLLTRPRRIDISEEKLQRIAILDGGGFRIQWRTRGAGRFVRFSPAPDDQTSFQAFLKSRSDPQPPYR